MQWYLSKVKLQFS